MGVVQVRGHAGAIKVLLDLMILQLLHSGLMGGLLTYGYHGDQETVALRPLFVPLLAQSIPDGLRLLHLATLGCGDQGSLKDKNETLDHKHRYPPDQYITQGLRGLLTHMSILV